MVIEKQTLATHRGPLHHEFATDNVTPKFAGDEFNTAAGIYGI